MDGLGDASSGAAPPLGGLGNYKGVMLCNRPSEGGGHVGIDGSGKPSFKSMIAAGARDQLGLQPCKQPEEPMIEVKSRGPSAALRRHLRWVKELQEQVRDDQKRVEQEDGKHVARLDSMQKVFKSQRDAIRQMRRDKGDEPLDREELLSVMEQFPPTGATVKNKKKPLWALTEKEKEVFDEQEASDLINFAEGLDYDKFIGDQEFKQAMQVMYGRANKLQKEQDAFKDSILREFNEDGAEVGDDEVGSRFGEGIDGSSLLGDVETSSQAAARKRRPPGEARYGDRPDWDGSTACGEDRPAAATDTKAAADKALENNPALRAVHSKESTKRLIEKAKSDAGSVHG